jgi:hypothetical protein
MSKAAVSYESRCGDGSDGNNEEAYVCRRGVELKREYSKNVVKEKFPGDSTMSPRLELCVRLVT